MQKKILIIEDETALLYAFQSQLSAEGFKVFVASDGLKALEMATKEKPNLILLDILLPKIDGWEFLKNIKKDSQTKNIPVVIVSNLSDEESRKKGKRLGAKDYLAKVNYSMDELILKIKKFL